MAVNLRHIFWKNNNYIIIYFIYLFYIYIIYFIYYILFIIFIIFYLFLFYFMYVFIYLLYFIYILFIYFIIIYYIIIMEELYQNKWKLSTITMLRIVIFPGFDFSRKILPIDGWVLQKPQVIITITHQEVRYSERALFRGNTELELWTLVIIKYLMRSLVWAELLKRFLG